MKISRIYDIINRSGCAHKDNVKEVVRLLAGGDDDFFIFLLNIVIDFRINSVQDSHLISFLNVYLPIDTTKPIDEIAADLHKQLLNFFSSLSLISNFKFTPTERLINVIPYRTFLEEHLPKRMSVGADRFYHNYNLYISRIQRRGGATALKVPYRKYTVRRRPGVIQKRIVWLAKYEETEALASAYCRLNKKATRASAYNDILGLGFEDATRPGGRTLLLYLLFPDSFAQECYKPTFIEGPLWGYKNSFFLNTTTSTGYGRTSSTDRGRYEASECVTDAVDSLTADFELGVLGYAEAVIDKSNRKANILVRLAQT